MALVGARNASGLGERMARRLAQELGRAGLVTIVSGLARGIDAAAHEASLKTGTIAIQGGGIDLPYPAENEALFRRIGEVGLLISEQPMGLAPQARHFPRRNRIISGIAQALVVVEAAARSGSLITARNALDQGREVLAVPGHPYDGRASGCNMLIRDGATLVRSAADILEAIGPIGDEHPLASPSPPRTSRRRRTTPVPKSPRSPAFRNPARPAPDPKPDLTPIPARAIRRTKPASLPGSARRRWPRPADPAT